MRSQWAPIRLMAFVQNGHPMVSPTTPAVDIPELTMLFAVPPDIALLQVLTRVVGVSRSPATRLLSHSDLRFIMFVGRLPAGSDAFECGFVGDHMRLICRT